MQNFCCCKTFATKCDGFYNFVLILMKIVIASDSFKGSLSSLQVADAIEEGVRSVVGDGAEIVKINVADGGEGTTEVLIASLGGEKVCATVSDPLGRPVSASYGIAGDTAVMEMAAASGLPLLEVSERNPLLAGTKGPGEIIADALARGCRNFLVGIGGSATNDGGMGMLSALGWRFLDAEGNVLEGCGASLGKIRSIDDSRVLPALRESSFTVACDVDIPFYGPGGAAYLFAPQKGATPQMVAALDRGLGNLASVIASKYGIRVDDVPGAGAAGGLGGAFLAFLGAKLVPGIEMVLEAIRFDEVIKGADLVFTGEGRIDSQTLHGKTPSGVLSHAAGQGVKVIAIGGRVDARPEGFFRVIQASPADMPLEQAMDYETAFANVRAAAVKAMNI